MLKKEKLTQKKATTRKRKKIARPPAGAASVAEKLPVKSRFGKYLLRLYVAGITPRSTRALMNIRKICEEHLQGRYQLKVIDVYQQPTLAKGEQIIAAPTLIKHLPAPLRRFVGDMSNTERILVGLDLRPVSHAEQKPTRKSNN
jgi:circadian clock protein KaiB